MKLNEMNWPDIKEAAHHTVAVLPIAAIEQHGPHLSVSTDTAIVSAVAERAESAMPSDVVLCPTLCFGSSHHHLGFPGTMSISHETYVRVLVDLTASLVEAGFQHIVLLNGHGGNVTPGKFALSLLSERYDDRTPVNIALATYWELAGEAFTGASPLESPALSHACEYETSLMLHLYPRHVDMARAQRAIRPPQDTYIHWENDGTTRGVSMNKRTHFISSNGSSGCPQLGTVAKGEHLLEQAVAATVEFLRQFQDRPMMPDLRPKGCQNDSRTCLNDCRTCSKAAAEADNEENA